MHSDGSIESYAYRPDGELTHASDSEKALVFERDPLGRILKEECYLRRSGHVLAAHRTHA